MTKTTKIITRTETGRFSCSKPNSTSLNELQRLFGRDPKQGYRSEYLSIPNKQNDEEAP